MKNIFISGCNCTKCIEILNHAKNKFIPLLIGKCSIVEMWLEWNMRNNKNNNENWNCFEISMYNHNHDYHNLCKSITCNIHPLSDELTHHSWNRTIAINKNVIKNFKLVNLRQNNKHKLNVLSILKSNKMSFPRNQSKYCIRIFRSCMLNCCLSKVMVSNQKCWAFWSQF